jgi:hypothetical protein
MSARMMFMANQSLMVAIGSQQLTSQECYGVFPNPECMSMMDQADQTALMH